MKGVSIKSVQGGEVKQSKARIYQSIAVRSLTKEWKLTIASKVDSSQEISRKSFETRNKNEGATADEITETLA